MNSIATVASRTWQRKNELLDGLVCSYLLRHGTGTIIERRLTCGSEFWVEPFNLASHNEELLMEYEIKLLELLPLAQAKADRFTEQYKDDPAMLKLVCNGIFVEIMPKGDLDKVKS